MLLFSRKARKQVLQWILVISASLPSVLFCSLESTCGAAISGHIYCAAFDWESLLFINFLFFVNVCILFYIVSLLQRSTWVRSISTSSTYRYEQYLIANMHEAPEYSFYWSDNAKITLYASLVDCRW